MPQQDGGKQIKIYVPIADERRREKPHQQAEDGNQVHAEIVREVTASQFPDAADNSSRKKEKMADKQRLLEEGHGMEPNRNPDSERFGVSVNIIEPASPGDDLVIVKGDAIGRHFPIHMEEIQKSGRIKQITGNEHIPNEKRQGEITNSGNAEKQLFPTAAVEDRKQQRDAEHDHCSNGELYGCPEYGSQKKEGHLGTVLGPLGEKIQNQEHGQKICSRRRNCINAGEDLQ